MPGTFMRAIAIMPPGIFLSQPPTTRTPSMAWPLTLVSMASAMTSRDTSEYFIASVPIPIPSVTVGTPKVCGLAPAFSSAWTARSTSGWMPALQGFMVECPFATPMIGLSKSASPKPTARSMARFGERATPWVISLERRFAGAAGCLGSMRPPWLEGFCPGAKPDANAISGVLQYPVGMNVPELWQLRYFMALAERLHFGRAAEALNISQPPLSRAIRSLEAGLGVTLFARTRRRVELTPEGTRLVEDTRRLLSQLEHSVQALRAMASGEEGRLR